MLQKYAHYCREWERGGFLRSSALELFCRCQQLQLPAGWSFHVETHHAKLPAAAIRRPVTETPWPTALARTMQQDSS